MSTQVTNDPELLTFVNRYAGDPVRMQLLAFWSRHPNAKFTAAAICCALDCKKLDMRKALGSLVESGLLVECHQKELTCYSLTLEESMRGMVLEFGARGWDRWRPVARRFERGTLTAA